METFQPKLMKSQPWLKRSSHKIELFRFFEEFIVLFKSILFELCETVIAFKNLIILKP
jgi:hypothetical protein